MVDRQASNRRPTINDVAVAAGVSRGTVSRVLNGGHWVSPDAAQSVEAAIRKTGYRVNPHARSLATARTGSVAFLLNETTDRLFSDPNFSVLLTAASQAVARRNLTLVLILAGTDEERRRARDYLLGGHVDGVLVVSWHRNADRSLLTDLTRANIPVIACGIPLEMENAIGWVAADDYQGARQMTRYLADRGHTHIATITGPEDQPGGIQRFNAFRDELGDAFEPDLVAVGDYSAGSGSRAMAELLAAGNPFDAVFAANDAMAAGAIAEAQAHGLRIPEDIAIAGFDDSPIATTTTPTITTMHQPFDHITAEMVRLLVGAIDGERRSTVLIQTDLIERESA